jgi:hypothetical protein
MSKLKKHMSSKGMKFKSDNVVKRLNYATFNIDKFNLLYVETPKCACSTMKNIMCYLDGVVPPRKHVGKESSFAMAIHNRGVNPVKNLDSVGDVDAYLNRPDAVRFCIVRNPYARLASAWADKIRQREPGYKNVWKKINIFHAKPMSEQLSCPSFKEFVLWVVNAQNPQNCNIHWRAMHKLLHPDLMNYTHVLKTENFVSGFQEVLDAANIDESAEELLSTYRTNESLPIVWKALYTEELANLVYSHYQNDFDIYGYDRDSWQANEIENDNKKFAELEKKYRKLYSSSIDAVRNRNDVIEYLVETHKKPKTVNQREVLVVGSGCLELISDELKAKTPAITWTSLKISDTTSRLKPDAVYFENYLETLKWFLSQKGVDCLLVLMSQDLIEKLNLNKLLEAVDDCFDFSKVLILPDSNFLQCDGLNESKSKFISKVKVLSAVSSFDIKFEFYVDVLPQVRKLVWKRK